VSECANDPWLNDLFEDEEKGEEKKKSDCFNLLPPLLLMNLLFYEQTRTLHLGRIRQTHYMRCKVFTIGMKSH